MNTIYYLSLFLFFFLRRAGSALFSFSYELGLVHTSNPVAGWRFGSKRRAIISSSES